MRQVMLEDIEVKVWRSHIKIPMILLVPILCIVSLYVMLYFAVNTKVFGETLQQEIGDLLGGKIVARELVVEPDLGRVHLYGGSLKEKGSTEQVVDVDEVHVRLSRTSLLSRHVYVTGAQVVHPQVYLHMDEAGELNLLRALGLYEESDPDEPGGEMPVSLTFAGVDLLEGHFRMKIDGIFEIEIPTVGIEDAHLRITEDTLLIDVPTAQTPRANLRFYNELFGFPEEDGDWTFGVDDFDVQEWRWSGSGFTVERFTGMVEGYTVLAGGHMSFPDEGDDGMIWGGKGELTAPFWSPLVHYFVGETLHYSIPDFEVSGEGTLNWVESRGELYADRIDAAGIQITDLRSRVALHDQMVEVLDADFSLYGGQAHVGRAYFDMFELVYSGDITLDEVDFAGLTKDFFELEADYLSGDASGSMIFSGTFPESVAYDPEKFTLYEHTTDRWIDLELTSPLIVMRESRDVIPARAVRIEEGGRAWVDQDRAVIPSARVVLDNQDVFDIQDLTVNFAHYTFEPYRNTWGGRIQGTILDTTRYLSYYDIEGVKAGRAQANIALKGDLMAPDVRGTLRVDDIRAGKGFDASRLSAKFDLRDGSLELEDFTVDVPGGRASARGVLDLFERTKEPDPEWGFIIYEIDDHGRIDLELKTSKFDLGALSMWTPTEAALTGKATVDASVSGRLDALLVCGDLVAEGVNVFGEPLEEVRFAGSYRDSGVTRACASGESQHPMLIEEFARRRSSFVVMEELFIEHESAGSVSVSGGYGLDEHMDLSVVTSTIRPGALRALSPYDVVGTLEAVIDLGGSLDVPELAGSVRGKNLGAEALRFGDLALTMDTLTRRVEGLDGPEEERVLYMAGGVLPWFKIAAEVPLDSDLPEEMRAPIYTRIDVQDFDLVDFVSETGALALATSSSEEERAYRDQLERLANAEVSGEIEVFTPPSFDRINVLMALERLRLGPEALQIANRSPVVLSYRWEAGEQSVVIDTLEIGYNNKFVSFGGYLSPDDEFLDLKVDGVLDLGVVMALKEILPDLVPEELMDIRGAIDIAASFRGPLSALLTQGDMTWRPSTLELRSLSDPIVIQEGVVGFTSEGLVIEESSPINGSILGGVFSLFGAVKLEDFVPRSFLFSLWTHNISYAVPEMANVTLDTDLELRGGDIDDFSTWKVAGEVEILDGLFYQNISVLERELTGRVLGAFNRTTEVYEAGLFDEFPELEQLELDVTLRARDGFRLKNQIDRFGLDLEFRIDLLLANTIEDLSLTGDVDVIDGDVLFQGEKFVVRTGTVRFSGDPGNPYVDIVAVADIRNACRGSSLQNDFTGALALNGAVTTSSEVQDEIYQISLNVRGESDNLNILYDSVPYADQRDIISLILTGCTVDLLTASSASQPTLETLLGPLIGRLEREIQEVVRVEEFNITPGVNRTQVLISDDLTRRLSWRFRLDKAFNDANSTGQSGQLEYQLTDRWAAILQESSYSDLNTSSRFQIDLKLKYRVPLD